MESNLLMKRFPINNSVKYLTTSELLWGPPENLKRSGIFSKAS